MILVDKDIRKLIEDGVIYRQDNYSDGLMMSAIGAIGLDLHTEYYANVAGHRQTSFDLHPGETVFVGCNEIVKMPKCLAARIVLRNSRIRQGFVLEAPVYQPGHHTRLFFRLSNLSDKVIHLSTGESFASVMFEQLTGEPEKPYEGAFQNELDFSDMASYDSLYKQQMKSVDEKVDALKDMEKNVYTNTITLMSIFIALFSLININIDLAYAKEIAQSRLLISNLVTIGSIAFLVALIKPFVVRKKEQDGAGWNWLMMIALALLLVAVVLVRVL